MESDRISKELEELTGKIGIADNDLSNSRAEYESTKAEYEEAEEQLSKVNSDIENVNSLLSNTELESQRLNGGLMLSQSRLTDSLITKSITVIELQLLIKIKLQSRPM